jgi:predicted metalloprotease with PDZ domain
MGAVNPEPVRYSVSMGRAPAHYMDVTMEVQVPPGKGELRLAMPVWTPGHYLVEDFAGNIDRVRAFDATSGEELGVRKLEKSLWSVPTAGVGRVRVEYPVYAFVYTVGTSLIDSQHAIVNGASVFMYVEGMKEAPVELKVTPFPGWKAVSTGLERKADWEFEAPDYDRLVDSPLEVGNQEVRSFESGGAKYEVSMFGPTVADRDQFVKDVQRVVESTVPIFGHVPYKRYVFLVNFTDVTGGGLEHLNSTMCFMPRLRMLPKEEYHVAMGLFSHEFFHTWNVKRMRPSGLGPFNYASEVYTKSLWIAEGITSYYDDLILRRAGMYTVEEYLEIFASGNIDQMKSLPGSRHQSAEEASFDTWTKFYKPNENSPNVTTSYYTQGAVIGWMIDMALRNGGHGTLDEVMKRMYDETFLKEGRAYTDEEFEAACVGVGGGAVKEIFDSRVHGHEEVDFEKYLGYAGLRLGPKSKSQEKKGFLGVRLGAEDGRTVVKSVLAGSPAESMGLSVNDEVVGAAGLGLDKFSFYVRNAKEGQDTSLTVARDGRLMDVQGRIGSAPTLEWRVYPAEGATESQKALFKGWMLADWKRELEYPEYAKSPDRKRPVEYV